MEEAHGLRLIPADFQEAQSCHRHLLAGRFRYFKTQPDMALTGKMIDLAGLCGVYDPPERGRIRKIAVVQEK